MTTVVLVRRFLADYVRNPVNLLLLMLIPTVFVVVVGGRMADFAELLGGAGGPAVETATAGWAAAFLAGVAMYFQTAASGDTDRRVVIAGLGPHRLVAARLLTGVLLAALVSATALVALAVRTGIDDPLRAVSGTLMFAVIYVGIGAAVGTLTSNPVNGTLIVLFVWIFDVFFGPAMGAADRLPTRGLPTHFVTLWMVDLPSRHGGRLGDLGWAFVWTLAAIVAAWFLAVTSARVVHPRTRSARPGSVRVHGAAAGRAAWRDAGRNRAQWVLFVVVPAVFILAAEAVTPNRPITFTLRELGRTVVSSAPMPAVHGATMAPIAVAALAALVGLFALLDSRAGDRRTVLAGLRPGVLFSARLAVLAAMVVGATAVSLATTSLVFQPERWLTYAAGNLLVAVTYALVGVLSAPVFGRVGGVFVAFLLPFLDVGITQSPMLNAAPSTLSTFLPGYGGSRVLLDGAFTLSFDETRPLLLGIGWFVGLLVLVTVAYRRATTSSGSAVRRSRHHRTLTGTRGTPAPTVARAVTTRVGRSPTRAAAVRHPSRQRDQAQVRSG